MTPSLACWLAFVALLLLLNLLNVYHMCFLGTHPSPTHTLQVLAEMHHDDPSRAPFSLNLIELADALREAWAAGLQKFGAAPAQPPFSDLRHLSTLLRHHEVRE